MKNSKEILIEIQRHKTFFRKQWDKFCQMVEDYAECVCKHGIEVVLMPPNTKPKEIDEISKKRGIKVIAINRKEEIDQAPKRGYIKHPFKSSVYLKVSWSGASVWVKKNAFNPCRLLTEFGNITSQRPATDNEMFICDCALLSIYYNEDESIAFTAGYEPLIYHHEFYKGQYFRRDEFIQKVSLSLGTQKGIEKIERAFERVKPRLPETKQPTEASRGKITKEEANIKARKLLKENPNYKTRELAKLIPCSVGLIPQLPVWKALREYKEKTFGNKKPKIVSLTKELEYMLGTQDEQLNQLIAEQTEDGKEKPRLYLRKHT